MFSRYSAPRAMPPITWTSARPPTSRSVTTACACHEPGGCLASKLRRGSEGEAAFAFEELLKAAVTGAFLAADYCWCDTVSSLATGLASGQPILPRNGPVSENRRDFSL